MIPEYKLYHGVVLSELIDIATEDIVIGELREEGRLSSYILNRRIGLHVKHSASRLPPWQFTITKSNVLELTELSGVYPYVFIALVCGPDGVAVLSTKEIVSIIDWEATDQGWIRVDRSRKQRYSISGNRGNLSRKKPKGVQEVICALSEF